MSDETKIQSEIEKEILKHIEKSDEKRKISKEEIKKIEEQVINDFDFESKIEGIDLSCPKKRVIYIDGKESLIYDDGEFFIEDTVDSKKSRKKIARKKAMEMYVEYFVRYILNPIIETKKINQMTRDITKETKNIGKKEIISKNKNKTTLSKVNVDEMVIDKTNHTKVSNSKEEIVR